MSKIELRPYQREVAKAVLRSVQEHQGHTFTVMIARQGGKNELSAHLEVLLLALRSGSGGQGIKAAPTFRPQLYNSVQRLRDRLDENLMGYEIHNGNQITSGMASWLFLSGAAESKVVGATATILLEGDEAQDLSMEKWDRDFRPMGAVGNTTCVLYGTAWTGGSLLEQQKYLNLELERKDGRRRHFEYDWQSVAAHNPGYEAYVQAERERLGPGHPLFTTQYELRPLSDEDRMFKATQLTLLHGRFAAEQVPGGWVYVGGLDVAGGAEEGRPSLLSRASSNATARDSMVLTVAAVRDGHLDVVRTYAWTDVPHHTTIPEVEALTRHWGLRNLVVDATGQGEAVASVLTKGLGDYIVTPFVFTGAKKSELAYELLAAVQRNQIRIHTDAPEELWLQVALARTKVRPSRVMDFFVDPREGHDDYLMSLALMARAASTVEPDRVARGWPSAEARNAELGIVPRKRRTRFDPPLLPGGIARGYWL